MPLKEKVSIAQCCLVCTDPDSEKKARKTKAGGESGKSRHRMKILDSCSKSEISQPPSAREQSGPGRENQTQYFLRKGANQDDEQESPFSTDTPPMTAKPGRPRIEAASTDSPAFPPETTRIRKLKKDFEEESGSVTKRQRTTRFNGVNPYNFDMKFHKDFDLAMKPRAAATKRAKAGQLPKTLSDISDLDSKSPKFFVKATEDDNDNEDDDTQTVAKGFLRRDPSKYATSEDAIYPHRRRSTRTTHDAEKAMNYDMHHHASFDSHHRPKQVARRREQRLRSVTIPAHEERPEPLSTTRFPARDTSSAGDLTPALEGVFSHSHKDSSLRDEPREPIVAIEAPTLTAASNATASRPLRGDFRGLSSALPPLPNAKNQHFIPKIRDWVQLTDFDRRLFLLQRGAPVQGNTLPLKWSTVKQILFDEGFEITLDSVNSAEGTEMIAARYERTRRELERFFAAEPEPMNKRDWTLLRVEGVDVLDKKRGSKYWKHNEDSIVVPTEMHMETTGHVSFGGNGNSASMVQEKDTGQNKIDNGFAVDTLETDKQINELLASAESAKDASVAYEPTETVGDSSVTFVGDEGNSSLTGHFYTMDEAQTYIMDVMGVSQPAASGITEADHFEVGEIEALFDPARPIRDNSAEVTMSVLAKKIEKQDSSATSQPAIDLASSKNSDSKKRKKRKVASDFFDIYEDKAVDTNQAPEQKSPRSDLPVENMLSSQELIRSHQSNGSSNSHRRRHR